MIKKPVTISNWHLPNRAVLQPMEGCDGELSGAVGALTRRHYLRLAGSGAGIIWFEAVSVCPEGRANPRQLYLCDETAHSYKALLEEVREAALKKTGITPKIIVQLTHSGRFAKPVADKILPIGGGLAPLIESTPAPLVAYRNPHWEVGREGQDYQIVTDDYCRKVAQYYEKAAKLAQAVGFDGIDVKCCHGYLMCEFLSAFERSGDYGGSFENRTRLFFDCVDAVKSSTTASVLITTRLNACDGFPYPHGYGVDENDAIDLSECKKILHILSGKFALPMANISLGNPYLIPHVNRPARGLTEEPEVGMERIYKITKELQEAFPDFPLVYSGLSYPGKDCVDYADAMLKDGAATLAGFGRMSLAYPQFFMDYLEKGSLDGKKSCLACGKCTLLMRGGSVSGCPVRDEEYKAYLDVVMK
ncbi:MAG: flavin oxidoreductase/NADH oxidase [Oscillospiraceae bacterium]|nr:flavin oxidoreductase/NADH oxidase [Oscillospiraceae bacterium]